MVVFDDAYRDHDHLKRGERCSRLTGSVNGDSVNESVDRAVVVGVVSVLCSRSGRERNT
jgi:hypothetical protein